MSLTQNGRRRTGGKRLLVLLLTTAGVATLLLAAGAGTAGAELTINSCTTIDASNAPNDGLVLLNQSIQDSSAPSCINITTSNVVLDGQDNEVNSDGTGNIGVNVTSVTNITVRNVTVTDWDDGIAYGRVGDFAAGDVVDANLTGNSIGLFTDTFSTVNVTESKFQSNTRGIQGVFFGSITGNDLVGNNIGVEIDGGGDAPISGNNFSSNDQGVLIPVSASPGFEVSNNSFNSGNLAIEIRNDDDHVVRDNEITNPSQSGILVRESFDGGDAGSVDIINNTVEGAGIGINISGIASSFGPDTVDVRRNKVNGSTGTGVNVENAGPDITVVNNTLTDNNQDSLSSQGGVVVDNTDGVGVTQNRVHRNTVFGVAVINSNTTVIRGNAVTDNCGGTAGIQLAGTSNDVLIESNNVSSNTGDGIDVGFSNPFDGSNLTIRDVRANDNAQSGITVRGTQSPTLRDIEANNNTNAGVGVNSQDSTLDNITALRNDDFGVAVGPSSNDTVIVNSDVRENSFSSLSPSTGVSVEAPDVAIRNTVTTDNDLDLSARDENTTLENVDLGSANVSGTASEIDINETVSPPADPSNAQNIGQYFNATNRTSSSFFDATVEYDQSDVTNAGVDESSLILAAFDSTWSPVSGSTVDTNANTVSANITTFSVFAPLADEGFTGTPGLGGGECVDRRDISRGQEDQECPRDRGLSRGESRDDLDRATGRNSDTARRDRGRRSRGRGR